MKLRHAAALALVGWYLMMPPRKTVDGQVFPDTTVAVSQWSQMQAYDTAKECEADAIKLRNRETSLVAASAICVESTDPRLKPN
jgi:hypothetical protein